MAGSLTRTDRIKWLLAASAILWSCQGGRGVKVELVNETALPIEHLEAHVGRATVSAGLLAPGAKPGPRLGLRAREDQLAVELSWLQGSVRSSWSGRIDVSFHREVEIAIVGPNLAVIRERASQ